MSRRPALLAAFLTLTAAAAVPAAEGDGFEPLPVEADLSGWYAAPHFNPRLVAAMAPAERAESLSKNMSEAKRHWRVETVDGEPVLVNDGEGPYLWTERDYGDFELEVDWKIEPLADSGVYLRGNPQVQIWDTKDPSKFKNDSRLGSGGIWNNPKSGYGSRGKDPLVHADAPLGEWNTFRIRLVGDTVTVHLNGELVVNEARMGNFWDRSTTLWPVGPVVLQTHGGETRWRNMRIRELPRPRPESGFLAADGSAHGDGWRAAEGHTAEVGADAHLTVGPLSGDEAAAVMLTPRIGPAGTPLKLEFAADGAVTAGNPFAGLRAAVTGEADSPAATSAAAKTVPLFRVDTDAATTAFDPAAENHLYLRTADGVTQGWLNGTWFLGAVASEENVREPVTLGVSGPASIEHVRGTDERLPPPTAEPDFEPIPLTAGLPGWTGDTTGYVAERGVMTCLTGGGGGPSGGNVYVDRELTDFTLRFDFKLPAGANNGVGLRATAGTNAAYAGMESQILDNTADKFAGIKPWQAHGSVYGIAPALRGYLEPTGHWNREEIVVDGDRVTVTLNGKVIVDADLSEVAPGGRTVDGNPHPGLEATSGLVGWLGHGSAVSWRDVRLRADR